MRVSLCDTLERRRAEIVRLETAANSNTQPLSAIVAATGLCLHKLRQRSTELDRDPAYGVARTRGRSRRRSIHAFRWGRLSSMVALYRSFLTKNGI
jgi:hypothetical protein